MTLGPHFHPAFTRMKNYWEKKTKGVLYYAQLIPYGVNVGDFREEDQQDNASACTDQQFLEGKFQDIILRNLGPETLAEIIAAVKERQAKNNLPHATNT
jgi:hypothetical protein